MGRDSSQACYWAAHSLAPILPACTCTHTRQSSHPQPTHPPTHQCRRHRQHRCWPAQMRPPCALGMGSPSAGASGSAREGKQRPVMSASAAPCGRVEAHMQLPLAAQRLELQTGRSRGAGATAQASACYLSTTHRHRAHALQRLNPSAPWGARHIAQHPACLALQPVVVALWRWKVRKMRSSLGQRFGTTVKR